MHPTRRYAVETALSLPVGPRQQPPRRQLPRRSLRRRHGWRFRGVTSARANPARAPARLRVGSPLRGRRPCDTHESRVAGKRVEAGNTRSGSAACRSPVSPPSPEGEAEASRVFRGGSCVLLFVKIKMAEMLYSCTWLSAFDLPVSRMCLEQLVPVRSAARGGLTFN